MLKMLPVLFLALLTLAPAWAAEPTRLIGRWDREVGSLPRRW